MAESSMGERILYQSRASFEYGSPFHQRYTPAMRVFLRLLIFACASLQLRAADHSQLESSLKQSLVDKPACLARPQTGDNLAFDAQGTCVKCGTPATAATFGN